MQVYTSVRVFRRKLDLHRNVFRRLDLSSAWRPNNDSNIEGILFRIAKLQGHEEDERDNRLSRRRRHLVQDAIKHSNRGHNFVFLYQDALTDKRCRHERERIVHNLRGESTKRAVRHADGQSGTTIATGLCRGRGCINPCLLARQVVHHEDDREQDDRASERDQPSGQRLKAV